jgi:hypothetical protein
VILNVLSGKYTPNARSVSPIKVEAYDEETMRLKGSIVRGMSGGIIIAPEVNLKPKPLAYKQ